MQTENDWVSAFLGQAGWGEADRTPLAGDASRRRYERLTLADQSVVLMIAPPETGERTAEFVRAAQYLSSVGLAAPHILASDPAHGLLLVEDLGDNLYARVVNERPGAEAEMYRAAVDVLTHLHAQSVPDWAQPYHAEALANLVAPAFEWYAGCPFPETVRAELQALFEATPNLSEVLILRDYHAENLIWRPEKAGRAKTALLDFQDAMAGHRAYDLVSLVEDARRDLGSGIGDVLIEHYLAQTGVAEAEFRRAYSLFGAQRNLRILGVFARLAIRDGKTEYLKFVPRVWRHLQSDLSHPNLARLRALLAAELPQPDTVQKESKTRRCSPTR